MKPTHTLNGMPAAQKLLWWQERGLSFTRDGYGSRIPTSWMVHVDGRWRRVYCCIWSNIGTCFIGKSLRTGTVVDGVPVPLEAP